MHIALALLRTRGRDSKAVTDATLLFLLTVHCLSREVDP